MWTSRAGFVNRAADDVSAAIDQILDPRAAVDDHRLAAGLGRVDRDLGLGLGG